MAVTDKERDECVAAAAERLTAMRRLVDALFEYAKADDGARALVVVPVDVGAVVAACVADLHPTFVERQWEPTVRLDEDVVAPADPEALARIVENALVNCLRYGAAAPAITLRRAATADGFTLTIANEAEGLEALDASRLFERFYRGDPSRRSDGSGLGLAIAGALARAPRHDPHGLPYRQPLHHHPARLAVQATPRHRAFVPASLQFQMPAALSVQGCLGLGGGSGDLGGCHFSESVTVPPAPGIRGCQRGRRAITERVSVVKAIPERTVRTR